jgi:hypothetical protein
MTNDIIVSFGTTNVDFLFGKCAFANIIDYANYWFQFISSNIKSSTKIDLDLFAQQFHSNLYSRFKLCHKILFNVRKMRIHAGIVIIYAVFLQTVFSSTCKTFQITKDNLNIALVGHSVLEINDTDHQECARTCMSLKICKSIDYDRTKKACKLNDADRESVDTSEFETKKGSIFSDISEWPSVSIFMFLIWTKTHHCMNKYFLYNRLIIFILISEFFYIFGILLWVPTS